MRLNSTMPLSSARPPKKLRSPMPDLSFDEMKNGLSKSSGASSSRTRSSFCQTVSVPSLRRASRTTSANGRSGLGAATMGGAPGGRRPEAAPPGPTAPTGAEAPFAGRGRRADDGLEGRAAGERRGRCGGERREGSGQPRNRHRHAGKVPGQKTILAAFDAAGRAWFDDRAQLSPADALPQRAAPQCIGRKRSRFGLAPSSPRRFFLSASYSW